MFFKGRAQCLVTRDNKILMVKHKHDGEEWYCTPGGGIEPGETPDQAALRELREECNVTGTVIKKISEFSVPEGDFHSGLQAFFYTYQVDIGDQTPSLGCDPELMDNPILAEVRWMALNELSEVDRAYLWSAGLLGIPKFAAELDAWAREISYPGRRNTEQKE